MNRLHQGQEGHVETQHLVFGMVGDPGQLVGVQTRVHGVQHPTRTTHAKVELQVSVAVPGQGGDAGTPGQFLRIQRVGHLPRPTRHVGPGVAVNVPLHPARNHFTVTVVLFGKFDQGRNQQ